MRAHFLLTLALRVLQNIDLLETLQIINFLENIHLYKWKSSLVYIIAETE